MKNEQKTFYIKRIERYNDKIKQANTSTILYSVVVGLFLLSLLIQLDNELPASINEHQLSNWLPFITGIATLSFILALINSIAEKAGYKSRIDEIKEIAKYHGLNLGLDDEKAKRKRL